MSNETTKLPTVTTTDSTAAKLREVLSSTEPVKYERLVHNSQTGETKTEITTVPSKYMCWCVSDHVCEYHHLTNNSDPAAWGLWDVTNNTRVEPYESITVD